MEITRKPGLEPERNGLSPPPIGTDCDARQIAGFRARKTSFVQGLQEPVAASIRLTTEGFRELVLDRIIAGHLAGYSLPR